MIRASLVASFLALAATASADPGAPALPPLPVSPATAPAPAPAPAVAASAAPPVAPPSPSPAPEPVEPAPPSGESSWPVPPPHPACIPVGPDAYLHDGFYVRFALGVGYTSIVGSGDAGRTSISGLGASLSLLVGGTPAPGLVIGGGVHATSANGSFEGGSLDGYQASGSLVLLGPFVDWFPDPRDGWHVGALAGVGGAQIDNSSISVGSTALGGAIFGGYDWWIGPQWSLGLLATASGATAAELNDGGTDTGYRATPLSFAISVDLLLH